MKFLMEDIKNIDQMKSADQKPRKVAEKRLCIDSSMATFTTMPSSRDTSMPLVEEAPIAVGTEVEILSPSPPTPKAPHVQPQSPPAQLAPFLAIGISLLGSPVQAGPSTPRETSLNENEFLELRAKMHRSASILKNKKLAEDLTKYFFPRIR